MNRRTFVGGAATLLTARSLSAPAVQAVERGIAYFCPDNFDTVANLKAQKAGINTWSEMDKYYPLPVLDKVTDFTLSIEYARAGHFLFGPRWNDADQMRLQRAVDMMNIVWRSKKFMEAVSDAHGLWWKYTKAPDNPERHIDGPALYQRLMLNRTPKVTLDLTLGSAAAETGGTTTTFRSGYLKNANVYRLCNTISHEYTHTTLGGQSEDWGYEKENDASIFVSYGIGGLTENLAAGEVLYPCDLTPHPKP